MSYSNGTTHYNLPQTVGTDKRDWSDTNQAFADIDAVLYQASETASSSATEITSIEADLSTLSTNLTTLTGVVNDNVSAISTINESLGLINNVLSQHTTSIANKLDSVAIAEPYDTTKQYSIGDIVVHAGQRYKCVTAVSVPEPFDADKWVGEDVQTAIENIPTPDASDISITPITGMSATNVQAGISELKSNIDNTITLPDVFNTGISLFDGSTVPSPSVFKMSSDGILVYSSVGSTSSIGISIYDSSDSGSHINLAATNGTMSSIIVKKGWNVHISSVTTRGTLGFLSF